MKRSPPNRNSIEFQHLFESLPGAYLILSPDLTIVTVTRAYLDATMRKKEELVGLNIFEAFPDNPDDPEATGVTNLTRALETVLRERRPHAMEVQKYDIKRPDSEGGGYEVRYWSPKNSPVLGPGGEVSYIVHSVEDVTEQVRLHQAADEQRKVPAELRTTQIELAAVILDQMYQFVALLDPRGRVLEVNRPALEAAGLARSDVRGMYFWQLPTWDVSPGNRDRVRQTAERARSGEFVREELQLYAGEAGTQVVTIDFSLKPIRNDRGELAFLLAEGRNISERKSAEAEIARKNQDLAALNEKLRELDKLRSQFFSNVSHELRTPLTLILGPLQNRLSAPGLTDPDRIDLELIERNARLLLKQVSDLLDLARLEAGRMTLEYHQADIAVLAAQTASYFESLARDRSIGFSVEAPPSLPAQIDPDKIERVLLNLLSNAFKFTPDGGEIRLIVRPHSGSVRVFVEDTGPGIPPELRVTVFERFRQVEGDQTRRHGGTGIGLSIVKEFVALHGGTVAIETALGGGTSVILEIPLQAPGEVKVSRAKTGPDRALAKTMMEELGWREHKRRAESADASDISLAPLVLVVEDSEDMRALLRAILAPHYRTAFACDGSEGLLKAIELRPDLIISDAMMPIMNGEEMILEIRRNLDLTYVPIIVLTARADEEFRVRLLQDGVQDFVNKPFSKDELLARVDRLIKERQREVTTLRMSEERYRTLVEASAAVVWTASSEGEFVAPQPAWDRVTGQTPSVSAGLGWLEAVHPEDRADFRSRWLRAMESLELFEAEGRLWSRSHDEYRFFTARAVALRTPEGGVREWIGAIYDIHDRTMMQRRLMVSLREKEVLLKEIHHRVKNNMQVISSLLRLQARSVGEERFQNLLTESENRVRAMALVHEKLYGSQTLSSIDFGDYLNLLARETLRTCATSPSHITMNFDIEPIDLDISRALPCGLIVNELLSNALKHAFPNGRRGTVRVMLKRGFQDSVLLGVEDDGVGVAPGLDLKSSTSLGLQIVRTLCDQIGGTMEISVEGGVSFSIRFPLEQRPAGALTSTNELLN